MNSTLEALGDNKVKLSVTIDEAEFDHDIDQAFRKIAKEVRLPGFRAGKAPRRVLEARIGVEAAREQALRDAIPVYLQRAVVEHEVDLIDTPEVEVTAGADDGPVGFDATCDVRPQITIEGYGGLRVEMDRPEASDTEIDEAMDAQLRQQGELADVDRPAADGDFLTLDVSATRDGEAVPGLNTEDWSYELGQGWVADDFDDQLRGATGGATLEFTTTPKATADAADFTVVVNRVQELVVPELTDDWVADNIAEFATVAEWRDAVRASIDERKLDQARQEFIGKTTDALIELTDIETPEPLVRSEMQRRVEATVRQMASQGMDVQQLLQATGQEPEQFIENFRAPAEQGVKVDLALRAVATAEALEATDDDVDAEYAHLALHWGQSADDVRKAYERNEALGQLKAQIRKTKALDWLLEHVEVVDESGAPLDREALLAERGHEHPELEPHDDAETTDDDSDASDDEPDDPPTESEQ